MRGGESGGEGDSVKGSAAEALMYVRRDGVVFLYRQTGFVACDS
jgi:hypothetical protein